MSKSKKQRTKSLEERVLNAGVAAKRNGELFPSEPTLAEMFGVSRPVLREALARLDESGLIFRRQGASTVLNEAALELVGRFDQFGEFSDVISDAGMKAKLELIWEEIQPWSEIVHGRFRSQPEYVLRSVKRWTANGVPVRAVVDVVPLPKDFDRSIVIGGDSVLKVVSRLFNESATWEIAVPTAILATTELSRWLSVRSRSPLLLLQTIGLTSSGQECFQSLDYHVPGLIPQGFIRVIRQNVK